MTPPTPLPPSELPEEPLNCLPEDATDSADLLGEWIKYSVALRAAAVARIEELEKENAGLRKLIGERDATTNT